MSTVLVNSRYLAPLTKEHAAKIKEWRNAQMDVLRQKRPLTDEDQVRWLEVLKTDETQILFVLMEKDDEGDRFIGYCGLTHVDYNDKRGEISFLLDPKRVANHEVYRQDFLSALYLLCLYAFEELHLHKLFTDTFEHREYHISILESFGFVKEGMLRDHYLENGRFINSYLHSVLSSQWLEIKRKHIIKSFQNDKTVIS